MILNNWANLCISLIVQLLSKEDAVSKKCVLELRLTFVGHSGYAGSRDVGQVLWAAECVRLAIAEPLNILLIRRGSLHSCLPHSVSS